MTGSEPDPPAVSRELTDAVAGMNIGELERLVGTLLAGGRRHVEWPTRPSLRGPRRAQPATYRLRVDLEHARPPIWRRLEVRSDMTLDVVHQVLQAAFGWTDSHLHRFALGGSPFDHHAELFLCPFDVEEGEDEGMPAGDVTLDETLSAPGDVLRYCYDYGDSWDLSIALEAILPLDDSAPAARCTDGRRAGPPEDCGGLRVAAELAQVLDDPARFDLDEVNQALTDPYLALRELGLEPRLVDVLNRLRGTHEGDDLVARAMGLVHHEEPAVTDAEKEAALRPMLWFLDRVGDDGLALTSAGYLRPEDVTATASVLPAMAGWIGAANREVHCYPVLSFRKSLQRAGLLRKHRGRLLLTRAGAATRHDPVALWRHLADGLPFGRPDGAAIPAGLLTLLHAASSPGEPIPFPAVADGLAQLGWRRGDGGPIDETSARWAAADTFHLLESITLMPRDGRSLRQPSVIAGRLARDALVLS